MAMVVMVCVRILVVTLLAMEDQEVHAERVEGGHEHTGQNGEVGETGGGQRALVHRFDDAVLGVEAREERRADQRQRTQQGRDPGDGHVLAHATHPADVLVVVHAMMTEPAPRNSKALKKACVIRWNTATE